MSCVTGVCGGWIELNIPQGVSFVEARSSTSLDASWNEVGIAVDVNAPFGTGVTPTTAPTTQSAAQYTLPETGSQTVSVFVIAMVFVGAGLVLTFTSRIISKHKAI